MRITPPSRLLPVLGIFAGLGLFVHGTSSAASPADPLDPAASVPPAVHRSSLERFRTAPPDKPLAWRAANDEVGRIGGWRAYAREAAAAAAAPAPAAEPAAVTAPNAAAGSRTK